MRLGIVVQRYGNEIGGGAELHARYIAEHLSTHHDVEVFTTRALDYITWKNHYSGGTTKVGPIFVHRFGVKKPRAPDRYGQYEKELLSREHTKDEELRWLELEGPYTPSLVKEVRKRAQNFDAWIIFSFRYYSSYHSLHALLPNVFLVPTAEPDPIISFSIFQNLFQQPKGIFYNSLEEQRMIQGLTRNYHVPGVVVGVGVELPGEVNPQRFRQRFQLHDPFILYIGRLDANKGVEKLTKNFIEYIKTHPQSPLHLVLLGTPVIPLPQHPRIRILGYVDPQIKFDALAACEFLVNPSSLESLSMVLLEAWAMKKAVLVNGLCPVTKGQVIRANGGLYYESSVEFAGMLDWLLSHPVERTRMGELGEAYYKANYRWEIIMEKYDQMLSLVNTELVQKSA